ncbi:MAG: proprotein convertase P-domain-containing protein [Deltaproteobacteria bacterium]|nr:proprotein convertase P-domain-containing protein [Deltaproteobacteria bacterium]
MRTARWLGCCAVVSAGCAFDPSGQVASQVFRDDSAADFGAPGAITSELTIEADGRLAPIAYVTGAVVARGANTQLFSTAATASWDAVANATAAGTALAAPMGAFGGKAPVGIGITKADGFTAWLKGEVWLEAGTHGFDLYADDVGILELAPADGDFTRVITAAWPNKTSGSFTAPTEGWYRFRAAYSDGTGDAAFQLDHTPPGANAATRFDLDRLRVPVGDRQGLVTDAFDDALFLRPVGRALLADDALDLDFGNLIPLDSGITAADTWSLHWAGQVRIDRAGDYRLLLDTDDGHRLRVDGTLVLDKPTTESEVETTPALSLTAGWHDLVIEENQDNQSAHARLRVAVGPDLTGGPFPLAHLRPVVPRTDRVTGSADDTDLYFGAGGNVSYTFTPVIPAGATVVGIDVGYTINHPHLRDLAVTVRAPDGTAAEIRPAGDVDRMGTTNERRTTHVLDGKPAPGAWKIEVKDTANKDGGNTRDAAISIHYRGGRPPIPALAFYESAVHDLGAPSSIEQVVTTAAAETGSAAIVRVRTCDAPEACAGLPWSEPVVGDTAPDVAPARYFQYRVELTSDGDRAASLDAVQVFYRP